MVELSLITGFGWGLAAGFVAALLGMSWFLAELDRHDDGDDE